MSSVFDAICYGPFDAEYHRISVDENFRFALTAYLTRELLPQVTVGTESFEGHLQASYDKDRFCGPNSLVRDIYKLSVTFGRGSKKETLNKELVFDSINQLFRPRREKQLRLWTLARQSKARSVEDTINRLAEGNIHSARCPICGTDLQVSDTPGLFCVICPNRCFHHDCHRDPDTGEFLHGHLFIREPD